MTTAPELAAKLNWAASTRDEHAQNRKIVKAALDEARAKLDALLALSKAAKALCKHPASTSYSDPRDPGGWDCPDCGESR